MSLNLKNTTTITQDKVLLVGESEYGKNFVLPESIEIVKTKSVKVDLYILKKDKSNLDKDLTFLLPNRYYHEINGKRIITVLKQYDVNITEDKVRGTVTGEEFINHLIELGFSEYYKAPKTKENKDV